MSVGRLENEWAILQQQFDSYEKYSLLIKLINIGLLSAAYFSNAMGLMIMFLLLVVWGQDAIWKTFQSRIENRLLIIEQFIVKGADEEGYQYNSQYQKNSFSGFALIVEYARQAIRPTVAFPHAVLLFIMFVDFFYSIKRHCIASQVGHSKLI